MICATCTKLPLGDKTCRIAGYASEGNDTCPVTVIVSPAAYVDLSVETKRLSFSSEKPSTDNNGTRNNAEKARSQNLLNFTIFNKSDHI